MGIWPFCGDLPEVGVLPVDIVVERVQRQDVHNNTAQSAGRALAD